MRKAGSPEDLGRMFLERLNVGDIEGVLALYEAGAVLAFPSGTIAVGRDRLREVYTELISRRPHFDGRVRNAVICGDLALTSTRSGNDVTAEVARRQPDGSWLWVINDPALMDE